MNYLECVIITKRNSIVAALTRTTSEQQPPSESPILYKQIAWSLAILFVTALVAIVTIRFVQAAEPYIHQVLILEGDKNRGQAIFQMNCAVCHGIEATGEVGPNLRGVADHKSRVNLIKQVISGKTPPMPQFQPKPQDMADLLKYLESL